ncbi:unnamed protein product [Brassicogethes aeneus]|uniref:Uncharacterized protein n=1 Tax=Brassicogethes aeneus TaxID=1431903 RepID=A0A9P0BCN9_BRAAE|nr:unnamed protein product [Brassicogethes aeneus]
MFFITFLIKSLNCNECGEVSLSLLAETLGPAFNGRYMSISTPMDDDAFLNESMMQGKRKTDYVLNFLAQNVEDDEEKPAWEIKNHIEYSIKKQKQNTHQQRKKRNTNYMQEWHCKSTLVWTDLGPDYFPRYLRSVNCLSEHCWFKIYKCKPRSFAVKILRRKRNKCVPLKPGTKIGSEGLPMELKELWVWEERPVNFCCDCTIFNM